jgi:hypothetical protein
MMITCTYFWIYMDKFIADILGSELICIYTVVRD